MKEENKFQDLKDWLLIPAVIALAVLCFFMTFVTCRLLYVRGYAFATQADADIFAFISMGVELFVAVVGGFLFAFVEQ